MKLRAIAALSASLAFLSCDKARNLANKASSAVKEKIGAKTSAGDAGKTADAQLRKLVDQTPEGAVFRKDLPFPARLDVRTVRRNELSGHFYQSSAIEKKSEMMNGTLVLATKLEHAANQLRYTVEQSDFVIPTVENQEAAKPGSGNPLENMSAPHKPVSFRKAGNVWKTSDTDGFRAATLSKQLTPVFEQLLIENALAPRPLWFAKRRIKIGDRISVGGDSLPMIVAGGAKGSMKLKLESFEAVNGHPCGLFSVTGDYSRKQFPDFEGNLTDEDVTIQSGKLWLSLIYPIILREELDTIQTFKSGGQGGLVARGQGTVKVSVIREWKRF